MNEPSHIDAQSQRRVLFSGVFMSALDVAIVAPALPLLRDAFRIDNRQASLFFVATIVVGMSCRGWDRTIMHWR